MSFPGAPGIISASPYAGAGFPPTFAIPQAAGTVFRKLKFYIGFLLLKHLGVLKLSSDVFVGVGMMFQYIISTRNAGVQL